MSLFSGVSGLFSNLASGVGSVINQTSKIPGQFVSDWMSYASDPKGALMLGLAAGAVAAPSLLGAAAAESAVPTATTIAQPTIAGSAGASALSAAQGATIAGADAAAAYGAGLGGSGMIAPSGLFGSLSSLAKNPYVQGGKIGYSVFNSLNKFNQQSPNYSAQLEEQDKFRRRNLVGGVVGLNQSSFV